MRRQTNRTSIMLDKYLIVMRNIHNDVNGNPRYEVIITDTENAKACKSSVGYTYRFTGHYCGELGEAVYALLYHLTFTVGDTSEVNKIKTLYKEEV